MARKVPSLNPRYGRTEKNVRPYAWQFVWYGGQAEKVFWVVLPNLLPIPSINLQWLEVPVTFGTIKTDIHGLAESRNDSGSVEVVGSIPIGSTLISLGKQTLPRLFFCARSS